MKRILLIIAILAICLPNVAQTKKTTTKTAQKTTVVKKTSKDNTKKTTATKTVAKKPTDAKATSANTKVAEKDTKKEVAPASTTAVNCGYLCNTPLPYLPSKLDILFIGNSFAIDTSTALPEILNSLGLSNVNVYVLYKGGCSMKEHYNYYKNGDKVYELWQYNIKGEQKLESATSINYVMCRFPYDVVIFQQYSLESGDYSSYEPYLSKIIQAYNINKIAPRTTFAFNQTWSYSSKHKNIVKYKNPENMYKKICESVKKMKAASGIDIIIPCGTAVQNARNVPSLVTDNEFTRDNQHIDSYMGRYLLACTFYESIIAPCFGRNIRDDYTVYGKAGANNQVNNSNRRILQNCARLAVANNYEVSEFIGE
ncbi:MAG: DUF4886 domain-containing protein [Bacteroidaceae bacterium]|nr:DUF4886 domain-containing protein [Bacteroidaceae bacterium]